MAELSYQGERVSSDDLLRRYNPVLLLLPRADAPGFVNLRRPGGFGRGLRGDYHPCSAEHFLSQVARFDEVRGWNPFRRRDFNPAGLDGLKQALLKVQDEVKASSGKVRDRTKDWELDIVPLLSADANKTWHRYLELLESGGEPSPVERVVYARCVGPLTRSRNGQERSRIVLQYWYLYLYNDAPNKHEGDWEHVALELDAEDGPVQAAYSGHEGGARRPWQGLTHMGERPVVYVARGSHAAYLDHMPQGHKVAESLSFDKNIPIVQPAINLVYKLVSRFLFFGGVRDYTPAPDDKSEGQVGVYEHPEPRFLPENAAVDDEEWWWMNLWGRWGSSHTRIRDFVGPFPPWAKEAKWDRPLAWIDSLRER